MKRHSSGSSFKSDSEPPKFALYKSPSQPTFNEGFEAVAELLRTAKKIVVLTGAGISVSCGIPDFRSKGTGLYSTLNAEVRDCHEFQGTAGLLGFSFLSRLPLRVSQQDLGLSCAEELFDLEVFLENPQPFFQFAKNLYYPLGTDRRVLPSDSHKLLALLEQRNQLLRVYSQNIDGLEQEAGVSSKRVVYAHGSLQWATCCKCKRKVTAQDMNEEIRRGLVARCQAPVAVIQSVARSRSSPRSASHSGISEHATRKRSRDLLQAQGVCGGVLKPGVTFFGETLSDNVRRCLESDRNKVDALIVIGTSLSVYVLQIEPVTRCRGRRFSPLLTLCSRAPISKVVGYFPPNIPRILINRTIAHPTCDTEADGDPNTNSIPACDRDFRDGYVFDAYMLGFCDDVTRALAKRLFAEQDSNSQATGSKPSQCFEGALLATLDDTNGHYKKEDWIHSKLTSSIPRDRIFLFPGALAPIDNEDDASVLTYREVAHCDCCSLRIQGTIHKCAACFDFDLCQQCYPVQSKKHFDGSHQFVREFACPTDGDR